MTTTQDGDENESHTKLSRGSCGLGFHSRLADQSLVPSGAKVEKLAGDMKFTEGPVWLPKEKMLVFSDIPNSKPMQWSETN